METVIHCKYDELVDPNELKNHPKNRNKHGQDQVERLAEMYTYHGIRHPIIVSKLSGYIVAGHGRKLAALRAGIKEMPVVYQGFDSSASEYAFIQADNAIALWAELDLSAIHTDVAGLGDDFNIDMLGIRDFKLDESKENEGNCDPDEVPDDVPTKAKLGDLFILGDHRLICADSTDFNSIERLMKSDKADLVFTDPPYGVSYEAKCEGIANQSKTRKTSVVHNDDVSVDELKDILLKVFNNYDAVLADKSSYYVCSPQGGELGLMMMMMMQEANLICRHMIIWVKNAPVFSMGRLDYDYRHEPILFGWSSNRTHHKLQKGEFQNSVWEVDREPNKLHPTMKPIRLPVCAINNSCPEGGIVVDFFGGSGSTLIAAEQTGRKARLSEYSSHYIDVIIARWQKFTGKKAVREDGVLWDDIEIQIENA